MDLLENNMIKWHPRMYEIYERLNNCHSAGCTLEVGREMLNNPGRFILYCLSGMPVGNIIFDGRVKHWKVVDGNKRLRTIIEYVSGAFPLESGEYFNDLPGYLKDRIKNTMCFDSYFITSGFDGDKEVKAIEWFNGLKPEEVEHLKWIKYYYDKI